jgi:hypothetical protein
MATLAGDATLMAICTDGVYYEVSAKDKTRFVIVSVSTSHDEPMFGGRALEDITYLVKAVILDTGGTAARNAGARIDALLENMALTVSGYTLMISQRVERVRYTEVDPDDMDTRWQHFGGRYQVMVTA